jgi:hypothetical protein
VQPQRLLKAIAMGDQSMKDFTEGSEWHTMGHCAGRSHDKTKHLVEESTPRDRKDGGKQFTLRGMSTEGM